MTLRHGLIPYKISHVESKSDFSFNNKQCQIHDYFSRKFSAAGTVVFTESLIILSAYSHRNPARRRGQWGGL